MSAKRGNQKKRRNKARLGMGRDLPYHNDERGRADHTSQIPTDCATFLPAGKRFEKPIISNAEYDPDGQTEKRDHRGPTLVR